jgi:transposase
MEKARRQPSEHPTATWYPPEYTSVVCSDCDAVINT